MRRHLKNECYKTLSILAEANDEIVKSIENKDFNNAVMLLESCQDGAISVGNAIDKAQGEGTEAVKALEAYCEIVYQLHEDLLNNVAVNGYQAGKKLKKPILKTRTELETVIPTEREIVFLPYKASMWDSLESVWKRFDEDESVTALVIPIPYFDKNPDGSFARRYYEIDDFPDYVPVYHFEAYDFEGRHPDAIYIHNPYDDLNYVTSIDPFFYSENIKRFTDELVYIPYFVLWGLEPGRPVPKDRTEGYALTKGVINADRVVLQSEEVKASYIEVLCERFGEDTRPVWEQKLEGTGSPKIEKIKSLKAEDYPLPKEWASLIYRSDGSKKKVVFYNTSLKAFLADPEAMLAKIQRTIDIFNENKDDVVLWWRPHPLFKSTISSMEPQAWQEYTIIVDKYLQGGWGIYDDTPELDRAIAHSDGYYGDGSSVVELYTHTGKPIMIQNTSV